MKSFEVDLGDLHTIAAAILADDGVLLDANAGFLRLIPSSIAQPIGAKVSGVFAQPTFAALVAAATAKGPDGYRGLITIGEYGDKSRTMRGRVWRSGSGLRLLAEHDIADMEKLNDAILILNQDMASAQQELSRAHVMLRQREAQVAEASLTDALTGVGNRRKLTEMLPIEINRARRGGGTLCAVMADIDHFKRVNDTYGHAAGDKVLARFGELLRTQTRSTDIVTRYGGEEFVVLMPHTALEQAVAKADQIRRALAADIVAPLEAPVTSSFGVAALIPDEDGDALLDRADSALYRAKEGGRNTVVAAGADRR